MVGGFNTNIRYKGRMYHVQTKDGGEESPKIITLVYQGGAILFSKKRGYDEVEERGGDREAEIREAIEEQHRTTVAALKAGKLDAQLGLEPAEEASPDEDTSNVAFGAGYVSDRTLDEVIVAHLSGSSG